MVLLVGQAGIFDQIWHGDSTRTVWTKNKRRSTEETLVEVVVEAIGLLSKSIIYYYYLVLLRNSF